MPISSPVIVALDYPDAARALAMADQLDPARVRVKVGKEIFTRSGPAIVEGLHKKGFELFLDLKFHDIPNTVAGAVSAAAHMGVWMVNVHASGGQRMMEAAANAIANHASRPHLIAVTVLTSMEAEIWSRSGSQTSPGCRCSALPSWPSALAWMGWCAPPRRRACSRRLAVSNSSWLLRVSALQALMPETNVAC